VDFVLKTVQFQKTFSNTIKQSVITKLKVQQQTFFCRNKTENSVTEPFL